MRHFSLVSLLLILALAVAGCTQSKLAVVDPSRLVQESQSGKAGLDHLKQVEAAMQAQLASAQAIIEKNPNDEALRARVQQTFMRYGQLAEAEQQKVSAQINELMLKAIDAYRTEKGLFAVMNAGGVLSSDPKSDVTKEVITVMDRTPITFEQFTIEEIPMPATPSGAGARSSNATTPAKKR